MASAHHLPRLPPRLDREGRRPHRGADARAASSSAARTTSWWRAAASTRTSTAASSSRRRWRRPRERRLPRRRSAVDKSYDWRLLLRLLRYLRPLQGCRWRSPSCSSWSWPRLDLVGPYLTKVGHRPPHRRAATRTACGRLGRPLPRGPAGGLRRALRAGLHPADDRAADHAATCGARSSRTCSGCTSAYFDRNPVGRLMTRVTTDVDAVNELFTSGVVTVFGDLFTLLRDHGRDAGHELAPGARHLRGDPALLPGHQLVPRGARAQSFREVRKWVARINAFLQENLTGHVGGAALPPRGAQRARPSPTINRAHADANMRSDLLLRGLLPGDRPAGRAGHRPHPALRRRPGAARAPLTLGALVAFIQYSERFWRPISDLSEKFNILQAAMASSERIFALLDTPPQVAAPAAAACACREVAGARRLRGRVVRLRQPGNVGAAGHRLHGRARAERGARGRHRRGQDLDHQPARALLRRRSRGASRSTAWTCATLDPAQLRSSLALVLQDVHLFSGHHRLQHPARLGASPTSGCARRRARCTPTASSRRCRRATTTEVQGARRHPVGGPEAAPLLRPRPGPRPARADPRRGHLLGGHRDRGAHPGRAARCCCAAAPPSSSPTASRPSRTWTRSWSCTRAASASAARTRSCWRSAASTGGSTSSSTRTRKAAVLCCLRPCPAPSVN